MGTNLFSNRVVKTFELVGENGAVTDIIEVEIDIKKIASGFTARKEALINAERELKAAQKRNEQQAFDNASVNYADAFCELLELIFGENNTSKLFIFYKDRYLDMAQALAPFIKNQINPLIQNYKKVKKEDLKNMFK
jgi:hypothetical protein